MTDLQEPFIDPFADDIVNDPRGVDYSVPGLNEAAANSVIAAIDALRHDPRPRIHTRSPKALLVLSPRAGFGKSHLIGTLFKRLSGRATLVNIRPFEDTDTRWKSILMRLVQELTFPDRHTAAGDATGADQLELFAHGALSQVVADMLEAIGGNARTIAVLRRPASELVALRDHGPWLGYLRRNMDNRGWLGQVAQRLARSGMRLNAAPVTWLRVLYRYAYGDDWELRQACLDWLQCEPIDEELADAIGIKAADRGRVDASAGHLNDRAKARVLDLCRLAGFYRPFLICFDQTETYGKSPELARALGTVITDLTDEAVNQLTLLTANVDPWEKRLRLHWEEASRDRLAMPYLFLEGVTIPQARELAAHRLAVFDLPEARRRAFWGDGRWLEGLSRDNPQMSVRMFLNACSRRWHHGADAAAPDPDAGRVPLQTLFERYVDEVSAKPRRLVYDRDAFYWLVNELARGVAGISVDRVRAKSGEQLPRWRHDETRFVFGFESGNHWKRWHTIARTAMAGAGRHRVLVYPRTPELPRIPKPTWKVAQADIEQARRSSLLILELDRRVLVRLYAAHEFHADALQGDIEWSPEEVADFLRHALDDFWQSILGWPRQAPGEAPQPESPPPPTGELQRALVNIMRAKKFLSLEEVIERLPGAPDREAVLGICGETARIKVHTHPNMTVLQWQSAG
ncbi:MAG: hypothetical protein U5S82_23210 [Gammaproteobacteria bacterium]|nr:hypothetical protein [Gammaproteobacteria bacterium]